MSFNVWSAPWIPVKVSGGTVETVSLRDALVNAATYECVEDANLMREFGVLRFLMVFLMDAYKPQSRFDLEDLFEAGSFDAQVLDDYVKQCEDEGVSFDLFDPRRPFLQSTSDGSEKSVAKLDPARAYGNNHIHFDHCFESDVVMTPAEAMSSLCILPMFSTAGLQGPSTVNGAPPLFTVVRGKNLFETLVLGMVPAEEFADYDNPPPFWRYTAEVVPKYKVEGTSLLLGLTFPCRRVNLKQREDGLISVMSFGAGLDFNGYEHFVDPCVSYTTGRDGKRLNIKPAPEERQWLDFGWLFDLDKGAPYVVRQAPDVTRSKTIALTMYGVSTKQASYLEAGRGDYVLPTALLKSRIVWQCVPECIAYAQKQGDRLDYAFKQLQKSLNQESNGSIESVRKDSQMNFYTECRHQFFMQLLEELTVQVQSGSLELDATMQRWKEAVGKAAQKQYDRFSREFGIDAHTLILAIKHRKLLFIKDSSEKK